MSLATDPAHDLRGITSPVRPFARMLGGLLAALNASRADESPAPPRPIGATTEAFVDADYDRMAGFGSWEALRDNLRASADAPAAKAA